MTEHMQDTKSCRQDANKDLCADAQDKQGNKQDLTMRNVALSYHNGVRAWV